MRHPWRITVPQPHPRHPVDTWLVCRLRAKAWQPWIDLAWPDPSGMTQIELSRHRLCVGTARESHAMRGWGTEAPPATQLLPGDLDPEHADWGTAHHSQREPALPTARTGYLAGGCRVAWAGTVMRHGWRISSPHGRVYGGSRPRLPGALPPMSSRRQAVAAAVAAAVATNKNGHPRGRPFQ